MATTSSCFEQVNLILSTLTLTNAINSYSYELLQLQAALSRLKLLLSTPTSLRSFACHYAYKH
ncbi:unnamed protein product [Clonostachys rosea f. rosea IK726]|uniref:Uncharacterized protein n=1 Tax=Clonostachys rosea f. rosea IK726 TaxID=1349383 RepID=A0ACA9U2G7_BIOOC|nr:unnamed protein product [Clonostachys rosea f. rosea IK726]